ncbi:MAG: hypothetical protein WCG30_03950 [Candidatus Saccharibacteria bacterium]|jgi:hypothetical protein
MNKLENFVPKFKKDIENKRWFNAPAALLLAIGGVAVGAIASETFFDHDAKTEIVYKHPAGCSCSACHHHKPAPHETTTTVPEATTTIPPVTTTTEHHVTTTTIPPVTTTTKPPIPFKPPVTTTTLPDLGSGYGYGN